MNCAVSADIKEYIQKHGRLIWLSFAAAALCYGFLVFEGNIRIDTEELINAPGSTLGWLQIGRYGLPFLKRLLGLSTHHVLLSGIWFFVFFILSIHTITFLFYHISNKDERYPYWVFVLLYASSNIWCYQIYFSMQQAEVACAMFLIAAGAFLSMRGCFLTTGKSSLFSCLGAIPLLVLGFGVYQSFVVYYIAICVSAFLPYLWNQSPKSSGSVLCGIGKLLLGFIVSYLAYTWIANTWFMSGGEYLNGEKGWGRLAASECIEIITTNMKHIIRMRGSEYFSFYTIGAVFLVPAVLFVCREKFAKHVFFCVLYVLAAAGLLLTPFLMMLYKGEKVVTRAQFALPVIAAFLGMYVIGLIPTKRFGRLRYPVICLALLASFVQWTYCARLGFTDHVRYEWDSAYAEKVLTELNEECGGAEKEKPLIFVGRKIPEFTGRLCVRNEMFGWSFFEWDYHPKYPTRATHRIVGFLNARYGGGFIDGYTEEMRLEALEAADSMPLFPQKGSVKETEDFIVVHLSEINEET